MRTSFVSKIGGSAENLRCLSVDIFIFAHREKCVKKTMEKILNVQTLQHFF